MAVLLATPASGGPPAPVARHTSAAHAADRPPDLRQRTATAPQGGALLPQPERCPAARSRSPRARTRLARAGGAAMSGQLGRALVLALLRQTKHGTLTIADGARRYSFGIATPAGPAVELEVHNRRFYSAL